MSVVSRVLKGWGAGLAQGSVVCVLVLTGVVASETGALRGEKAVRVRFDVARGSRLRKVFERELCLNTHIDSWRGVGGLEFKQEFELASWHDSQRVVFVDEYGAVVGGVPDSITRRFQQIEMTHSHDWSMPEVFGRGLSGNVERTGRGQLVGAQVLFRRAEGEVETPMGAHEAAYTCKLTRDPDGLGVKILSQEYLDDLEASADLSGVLPWRDVSVGEHWFTGAEAFRELCWPSGRLVSLAPEGEPLGLPIDERLGRELEGTLRVELTALEQVRGVHFARLDFRGQLEAQATFEFDYEWECAARGTTFRIQGPVELDLEARIEGFLWWNLDAGHLDNVELEGDLAVTQDLSQLRMDLGWHEWTMIVVDLGAQRRWKGQLTARAEFELRCATPALAIPVSPRRPPLSTRSDP